MNIDFCICPKEQIPHVTKLDVIFRVWGTSAYKVPSKKIDSGKYYFLVTTRGKGCLHWDGNCITISQDEALLLQPTQSFSYECVEDTWDFWWFECFTLPCKLPIGVPINCLLTTFQSSLFEHALRYAKEGSWSIAESLFISQYQILSLNEIRRITPPQSLLLDSIEQYIYANFRSLQVNDLSDIFEVSTRTLYNIFHQRHHCSPKQFLDNVRLENGKQLLLNSTLSITSISEQLGYANPFHFSKRFHQVYGVSPSKFRQISW